MAISADFCICVCAIDFDVDDETDIRASLFFDRRDDVSTWQISLSFSRLQLVGISDSGHTWRKRK